MAKNKRVLVAMSGGVDSSTAAAILSKRYDVVGFHMTKTALPGKSDVSRLNDEESAASAAAAADILGIPLRVVDASSNFDGLIRNFCGSYNAGLTPNPCVICNLTIKWRLMLATAAEESAEFVATGHYARARVIDGAAHLSCAKTGAKDQTYFLHRLTQKELTRTIFPLSDMTKDETRRIAADFAFPAVQRSESQEICFVGNGSYKDLLRSRTPQAIQPGLVVDTSGEALGSHDGYQFYTIGQRKGLRLALGKPAYVVHIDAASAKVTLGNAQDLLCSSLTAADVNWIAGSPPVEPFEAVVKIRYHHRGAAATVTPVENGVRVDFHEPVRAVTPGQATVFYVEDEVIGGGWIEPYGSEFP